MLTFDSLPQARVVRQGGQQFAPPPAPKVHEPNRFRDGAMEALGLLVGLWPITAIVLLCTGFMIMAGNNGAP